MCTRDGEPGRPSGSATIGRPECRPDLLRAAVHVRRPAAYAGLRTCPADDLAGGAVAI